LQISKSAGCGWTRDTEALGKFSLAGKALAIRILTRSNLLLQGFKNGSMFDYTASLQKQTPNVNL